MNFGSTTLAQINCLFASPNVRQVPFGKRSYVVPGIHSCFYIRRNAGRLREFSRRQGSRAVEDELRLESAFVVATVTVGCRIHAAADGIVYRHEVLVRLETGCQRPEHVLL